MQQRERLMKEPKHLRKKPTLVNLIILVCLSMSALITFFNMYEYYILSTVMPAATTTALLSIWGGELLLIVVRQAIGQDVFNKNKDADQTAKTAITDESDEEGSI